MSELADRLRGLLELPDAATALETEHRNELSALIGEAASGDLLELAAVVDRVLQAQAGHLQGLFARALIEEQSGHAEVAGNLYLQLAQHSATQRNWEGMLDLAVRAMPLTGDYRLVRIVRRAGEHSLDITSAMALAQEECADSPDLLWEQSQEADANGDGAQALQLALAALEGYVAVKEPEHAEDPLLRVLATEERATYDHLLQVLRRMANAGQCELVATALELAEETFFTLGMPHELAEALAWMLERRPELNRFRALYAEAVARPLAHRDQLDEAIAESGLANPDVPVEDALAAFRELAAFSPGAYVMHRSWGVGLIKRKEDEDLFVDFEDHPAHRMALGPARQVLMPLAHDSLQVQRATDLSSLQEQAKDTPAEVIYRLIVESGGEIVTPDIKLRLSPWLIEESAWAGWWRNARKAMEEDPRIDCSQAFRHLYREAKQGLEVDVPLLPLDRRKGVKGAMSFLNKLLAQHPHVSDRARMNYGSDLRQWLAATHKMDEWIRALPLLMRWYPEREEEWQAAAEQAMPSAALTVANTEEDQQVLLDLGLKTRVWKEAAYAALASRFQSIRERALQTLGERDRDVLWEDFEDLLTMPGHYQQKMALADMILRGELTRDDANGSDLPVDPWLLMRAALSVVGSKAARAGAGTAHRLLRANGPLTPFLKDRPLDEEANELLDTFRRRPIEGEVQLQLQVFFDEIGQPQLSSEMLAMNMQEPEDESRPPELDPRITLMTRATLEMQNERLREMERLLAVDIPQEIAKARALGDLAENAEYHAARERQGITKALYDSLLAQMETAMAIEELHLPEGVAGVGKFLRLRNLDTSNEQNVWILGEGDSQYGHEVVSYKAPLGQTLVGKRVGEQVQMETNGQQRFEVLSIETKLP
ncbi:GreA/GreB family elongation factor [bacterium]|nr:GreA/GreB family elongation factor [bacterium]